MSLPKALIFKPRRFDAAESTTISPKSFSADSTNDAPSFSTFANINTYSGEELTKNDKYCVIKLPAQPDILNNDRMDLADETLNGYTDNSTKSAVVVCEKFISVWPYNSADSTPINYEFPLEEGGNNSLELAILTRPAPGTSTDPGLVTINSVNGHVRFYESVHYAPALGLINSKLIETTVAILAAQGEYITVAENVEPAGIVVATSWKRVVLVLLRDFNGSPHLSTLELISPSQSLRVFGWLGRGSGDNISKDVVSIKTGKISANGMSQEIIVQDAAGVFKKFIFQSSVTGDPSINHRKTTTHKLASYLENNIDGFIPGAVVDVKYLDLWPLRLQSDADISISDDVYTALVRVQSSIHGESHYRLLLVTMKINELGVLVYGSHQLPDVGKGISDQAALKPRLYIPKPGSTAFIVVDNSVILTDINTSFLTKSQAPAFLYYTPQWEDVINFKSSVQIVGLGYEDKVDDNANSSLVLITKGYGVLRIERFPDSKDGSSSDVTDSTDPVYLLKSHIQQAIFYHNSDAVDFDVGSTFPIDVVSQATHEILKEILESSCAYLPPFFSSTRDSFSTRITLLRELISYVSRNFTDSWFVILPDIVQALEKLEAAQNLWLLIDVDTTEASLLKAKLTSVIEKLELGSGDDIARSFFLHNVNDILLVLTLLVQQLNQDNFSFQVIVKILVATLHDAVVKNEKSHVTGVEQIPTRMLWIFELKLVILAEEVFSKAYCTKGTNIINTPNDRQDLVKMSYTLFFLVTYAIQFMQDTEDNQLKGYLDWYKLRKGDWVNALISNGMVGEALKMTENFQDFYSLALVLDKEKEQRSPEYVLEQIRFFVDKYGYSFASKLFEYYIKHDQIMILLLDCTSYLGYLEQYFKSNPRTTSQVAWIYYLQSKNFKDASNVLMLLTSKKETDNQQSQELNYSLAKLSAIAAKADDISGEESPILDEIAIEAENNLLVIRVQNKIHHLLSSYVQGKKDLITLDYFLKNFANVKIPKRQLKVEIEAFFQRFVDQLPILKEQLILLLTSILPKQQFSSVYVDALFVAALIASDDIYQEQAREVWLKLLTLTDDWSEINNTSDNVDEVNKMKVRETALYTTIKEVQYNHGIMSVLESLIESLKEESGDDVSSLFEKARQLVKSSNLALWVETIRTEAH